MVKDKTSEPTQEQLRKKKKMALKVTELSNPIGLMVIVPILDWAQGTKALIAKAERLGIIPECIASEKLDETGENSTLSITLWGCG